MIYFENIFVVLFLLIIFFIQVSSSEEKSIGIEIKKLLKSNKWLRRIIRQIAVLSLIYYIYKLVLSDNYFRTNYFKQIVQYIYLNLFNLENRENSENPDNEKNNIEILKDDNISLNVIIIYIFYLLFTRSSLKYVILVIIFILIYYSLISIQDLKYDYDINLVLINNLKLILRFIIIFTLLYGTYNFYNIKKIKFERKFRIDKFLFKSKSVNIN